MKKFLTILIGSLIVLGLAFGLIYYFFLRNNCRLPVGYTIGQVDSRFKVSSSTVLKTAEDAANRWNSETQENLFKYDPNAKLKINLIYDSRQADLDKLNAEIQSLSNQRQSVEGNLQQYQDLLAAYQQDLSSYNQTVNFWNSKGGAPPAVYSQLQQEKAKIDQERNNLIQMAKLLNLETANYNENLDSLKGELNSRKNLIVTQGEFDPNTDTIDIYTFGNQDELRLVLMHELGHALGLGHAKQPTSIMYELLDQQDLKNPTLSAEDIAMLKNRCRLNYYSVPVLDQIINSLRFHLKPIQ